MWLDFKGTEPIGLSAGEQTARLLCGRHESSMARAVFAARSKTRHRVSASSDLAFVCGALHHEGDLRRLGQLKAFGKVFTWVKTEYPCGRHLSLSAGKHTK